MAGYGLNSGEMGAVAGKIDPIRDKVSDASEDVGTTNIEAKDFGRVHHQAGAPFGDLVDALGKLVAAEATAIEAYSTTLRDARSEYDSNEWNNSDIFDEMNDA